MKWKIWEATAEGWKKIEAHTEYDIAISVLEILENINPDSIYYVSKKKPK